VIHNIFILNMIGQSEFGLMEMNEAKKPSKAGAPASWQWWRCQRRQSTPANASTIIAVPFFRRANSDQFKRIAPKAD
jgi:hypothetical protein